MCIFDRAQALEELERTRIIESRHQFKGISAVVCACGEPIPEKRRELLPGIQTCISCQKKEDGNG